LVGIATLAYFHFSKVENINWKDLAEALVSNRWQKRVAALKMIDRKGIEIGRFKAYEKILESPYIAERYWLARALGVSRQPETYKQLLLSLDDQNTNVVCMALYSLGRRGNIEAVKKIMNVLETSNHWYEQWYAYKALRNLGWSQTRSN
jgi:HEAT repeat protein